MLVLDENSQTYRTIEYQYPPTIHIIHNPLIYTHRESLTKVTTKTIL